MMPRTKPVTPKETPVEQGQFHTGQDRLPTGARRCLQDRDAEPAGLHCDL